MFLGEVMYKSTRERRDRAMDFDREKEKEKEKVESISRENTARSSTKI